MGLIFVFGSNLAGRHGKGAALYARKYRGAEPGVGAGRTGDAYALPTKDSNLRTLSLEQIRVHVKDFCEYAAKHKAEKFALTPVGTGLAGHKKRDIAQLFADQGLPKNVYLTSTWLTD